MHGNVCQPIKGHLREPFLLDSIGISSLYLEMLTPSSACGPSAIVVQHKSVFPLSRERVHNFGAFLSIKLMALFYCFPVWRHSAAYCISVWPCWSGQDSHLCSFQSQPPKQGKQLLSTSIISGSDKTSFYFSCH